MSKTNYIFTSANMGDVYVVIAGEYYDGCKDIEVSLSGVEERFDETDDADEVMRWLVANGVAFESKRSALFNHAYIQSVMIDGDATESSLLAEFAALDDDAIASKYAILFEDDHNEGLAPCPFCGGKASIQTFHDGRYGVRCDYCSSRVGGLFNTRSEAIAAWNRRAEL